MASDSIENLQIDPAFEASDADSAYDSEVASITTSLSESVTQYKFENGRRYHAYKEGSYAFPNDEKEMDRLDIYHALCKVALKDKLFSAPLESDPSRVLDIGTGTGIWAMEFGDEHQKSDVLGNDLSPIQPRWTLPNVHFEVDNIEDEWTYSKPFDFIHCRCMYGSIKDWPKLVGNIFKHLQPGGIAEFTDLDLLWRSPDKTIQGTAAERLNLDFMEMAKAGGVEPCPGPSIEKWAKEAGFVDIKVQKIPLPIGTWASDKRLKQIGAWNYLQTNEGLESFFIAMFTRAGKYKKEEVEAMCADARKMFKNPKTHVYYDMYNVVARKPENATAAA